MIMPGPVRRRALTEDEALAQMGPRKPSRTAIDRAYALYDETEQAAWDRYNVCRDYLGGRMYVKREQDARFECERSLRKARYGALA